MKNIVVVATGGTIAGSADREEETLSYTSATLSIDNLIAHIPSVQKIANISGEQIVQLDSSDMNPEIWLTLAKRINALLNRDDVNGVVVTHGTDTLEETAYFLNLVVKSLKPVVVVGAMRPATALSTDGAKNLYDGVVLAASDEAGNKGVLVCMNDTINASRDVTKTSMMLPNAFVSPDFGCLGYVRGVTPCFYRLPGRKHTIHTEFSVDELSELPQVEILYGYAGNNELMAKAAVASGAKGLIHAGMGNGNMSHLMQKSLMDISGQGIVVVRSSRVWSGIVARNGAICDDYCGFVAADSLNPQKARVLLMLALTQTKDLGVIQEMFWLY